MAAANHTLSALDVARFWSHVNVSTSFQCWEWRGTRNSAGYGRFSHAGAWLAAHRISFQLVNGDIGDGMVIRHKCDNPSCCNPRHLLQGTNKQNSADCVNRKRTATGEKNGRSKISREDVEYILQNPDKMTLKALASKFGMAQSSIHYIRCGRSWKGSGGPCWDRTNETSCV